MNVNSAEKDAQIRSIAVVVWRQRPTLAQASGQGLRTITQGKYHAARRGVLQISQPSYACIAALFVALFTFLSFSKYKNKVSSVNFDTLPVIKSLTRG